jgi:DNA-directed RNA polymerase subunit RPC12/RpoP
MPARIEYRCPRCRREFPLDRFGQTPSGGRATLCLDCAAAARRRPGAAASLDAESVVVDAVSLGIAPRQQAVVGSFSLWSPERSRWS